MRVALVDYDSGNLHSATKALMLAGAAAGVTVDVTADPDRLRRADRIVLPGDGAFPACRAALDAISGMVEALEEAVLSRALPFLGICVGMQMLATTGLEHRPTPGLGWIGGQIRAIDAPGLKVPHMGWNNLHLHRPHPVMQGITPGDHAYFVHGWHFALTDPAHLIASVDYGGQIAAVVGRDNILGTQFHPEKSGRLGLRLIGDFLRWNP